MTREEFETYRNVTPHKTQFGGITTLQDWPSISIKYDLDGLPPIVSGIKQEITVIEPEGEDPQLGGDPADMGGASLTKDEVADIPGWVSVEKKLKEALEAKWQAQQAQANLPPPPLSADNPT